MKTPAEILDVFVAQARAMIVESSSATHGYLTQAVTVYVHPMVWHTLAEEVERRVHAGGRALPFGQVLDNLIVIHAPHLNIAKGGVQ